MPACPPTEKENKNSNQIKNDDVKSMVPAVYVLNFVRQSEKQEEEFMLNKGAEELIELSA